MVDLPRVGIYTPSLALGGGGEKHALAFGAAIRERAEPVFFARSPVDLGHWGRFFGLDLTGCRVVSLPPADVPMRASLRVGLPHRVYYTARDRHEHAFIAAQGLDGFVNFCHDSLMPAPVAASGYVCMFPRRLPGVRARSGAALAAFARRGWPVGRAALDTYGVLFANSQYTAGWVREWWGREVDGLLHPPCVDLRTADPKERLIISVGRFFPPSDADHHHKRHDVLVRAFREMDDLHEAGWRLALVGTVADLPAHRAWVEELRVMGGGAPVEIHAGVSHEALRSLSTRARIYWHAAGFGTDAGRSPASQEHFGIAVAEAMSTGAIPVVHASGGPAEIVTDGVDGRLWRTVEELQHLTREIASRPELAEALAHGARRRFEDYTTKAFRRESLSLLDAVLGVR